LKQAGKSLQCWTQELGIAVAPRENDCTLDGLSSRPVGLWESGSIPP